MNSVIALDHKIKKYGITEKKKAELDSLNSAVVDAQLNVEQYQAMVNSLSAKSLKFQQFLLEADAERVRTLKNRDMVENLAQAVLELVSNSGIVNEVSGQTNDKTRLLSSQLNKLIDRLIYSADIINKLGTLVVRRKARNPLISDELVSMIGTVGKDANNAVALALVALTSVFTSKASAIEADTSSSLEFQQVKDLQALLGSKDVTQGNNSLRGLLYKAYEDAKLNYQQIHLANTMATQQLAQAQAILGKEQVKLSSLQAALSAGNAAALAS